MTLLPRTLNEAAEARGLLRAGGTDLTGLVRKELVRGPIVDLRDVPGLDHIEAPAGGGLAIGSLVPLARLAADPRLLAGWPALVAAIRAIGTPQIRARATLGGSLLQEVRCAYFRNVEFACTKKGGGTCFARNGDGEWHAVLDTGPCIATHPSTTAMVLWLYDAQVTVAGTPPRNVPGLLGDGADARLTHTLAVGQVLTGVLLPPPVPNERGGYARVVHRAHAEFPLVEAAVRVSLASSGAIAAFQFAVNGIANRPQRWPEAARACVGLAPDDPRIDDVFSGLLPRSLLPAAKYKALLLPAVLREALDKALGRDAFRG